MEKEALLRLLQERFGADLTVRVGTLSCLVAVAGQWTVDRLEPSSQAKLEAALFEPQTLQGTVKILNGQRQPLYQVTGSQVQERRFAISPSEATQPTPSAPVPSHRLGVPASEPSERAIPPAPARPAVSAETVAQLEARIEQLEEALQRLSQSQTAVQAIAHSRLRDRVEGLQARAQQSLSQSLTPLQQTLQQVQQTWGQHLGQVKTQVQTNGQQIGSGLYHRFGHTG